MQTPFSVAVNMRRVFAARNLGEIEDDPIPGREAGVAVRFPLILDGRRFVVTVEEIKAGKAAA